ncbi:hypothetical protein [uncultured Psychroserpens sp.]|uniref:leucine-rich repeat domain-containing protein n=1 Tax=uncultured Psychroserpens sp. TaxID=255436 RepID=UPI002604E8E1|nr:hypothetical protein [uncultured Psychroserpens sp.]
MSDKSKVLDLRNKQLKSIPQRYIDSNRDIESLILNNNKFVEFPSSIFEFKQLKSLAIKNNDIHSIPKEIYELRKLENLDLRGTKIHELPSSLKSLTNMKLIIMFDVDLTDIQKNNIKCVLPPDCEVMFSKKYREYPPYECDNK